MTTKIEMLAVTARRRSDSQTVPKWVLRLLVTLAFAVYLLVTYWLIWPYEPFVINGPISILNENQTVEQGDFLIYEKEVEKKMAVPATIYKCLINTYVIAYTPITGNIPIGKRVMRVKQPIPLSAEPGEYRFKWEGHYKVNPLRTIIVTGWSVPFKVVQRTKSAVYIHER